MINFITLGQPSVCSAQKGEHHQCWWHKPHKDKPCFFLHWPTGMKVCDNLGALLFKEGEERAKKV
jgi:hypothetical protein